MTYDVHRREVNERPILSVRAVVRTDELVAFFDAAVAEMRAYLAQLSVTAAGPPGSLWHSAPGEIPDASDVETYLPLERPVPSSGRMTGRALPAGLEAFTVHAGNYDTMGSAFDAVWNWLQANGYQMDGPPADVVLVGPGDTAAPDDYRTEIVYRLTNDQ